MARFTLVEAPLHGLTIVRRMQMGDARGYFSRVFCAEELASAGWQEPIAQINLSYTAARGTVRGMHYQLAPFGETKLVTCLRGEVWDVAVDLRVDSPTFLRWHASTLSAKNLDALLIPKGFAHGFQALTDDVELLYAHSQPFAPAADAGLNPTDTRLAIEWPLAISEISAKDMGRRMMSDDFEGVQL